MPTVPYVKQTWTDGVSQASAARLTVIENGIYDASLAPAVRVYHNAAQSIANNTVTTLAFNSERFDQASGVADTMHDNVTNNSRLTCRYAGVYQITAQVGWAVSAAGSRYVEIRVNNAIPIALEEKEPETTGTAMATTVSTLYAMAVNDYVEVRVFQDSGGALNVNSTGNWTPEFMMVRVA